MMCSPRLPKFRCPQLTLSSCIEPCWFLRCPKGFPGMLRNLQLLVQLGWQMLLWAIFVLGAPPTIREIMDR